jgi:hypothetical protein
MAITTRYSRGDRSKAYGEGGWNVSVIFVSSGLAVPANSHNKYRFQWASCQLDNLIECLDYPQLQMALISLPNTLNEIYTRILNLITSAYKPKAIRILQFLTFSERPLRIEEAVDLIAIDPEGNPRFKSENRMPLPRDVSRYCSSLVVV